jgi:gas vesicle protein
VKGLSGRVQELEADAADAKARADRLAGENKELRRAEAELTDRLRDAALQHAQGAAAWRSAAQRTAPSHSRAELAALQAKAKRELEDAVAAEVSKGNPPSQPPQQPRRAHRPPARSQAHSRAAHGAGCRAGGGARGGAAQRRGADAAAQRAARRGAAREQQAARRGRHRGRQVEEGGARHRSPRPAHRAPLTAPPPRSPQLIAAEATIERFKQRIAESAAATQRVQELEAQRASDLERLAALEAQAGQATTLKQQMSRLREQVAQAQEAAEEAQRAEQRLQDEVRYLKELRGDEQRKLAEERDAAIAEVAALKAAAAHAGGTAAAAQAEDAELRVLRERTARLEVRARVCACARVAV